MADIRRDENKREQWLVTNHTKNNIAVGDLLLLPVFKPGCTIDVLRYYTREKISHSVNLRNLLKSGKFSLNKKKLVPNQFPGPIAVEDVDNAITPAEENELQEVLDDIIENCCVEEVEPGQPVLPDTGGVLLYGIDPNDEAQPIGITGEENNAVLTQDLDAQCLLEDILIELIKANIQMSIMTGNNITDKDIGPMIEH